MLAKRLGRLKAPVNSFVLYFPVGHQHAGHVRSREHECDGCGKPFTQIRVNPEWLAGLGDGARTRFLDGCQQTAPSKFYIPARCGTCERETLREHR